MGDGSAFTAHVEDKHLNPHPQYEAAGAGATAAAALAAHVAASDPHTGYRLESVDIPRNDITLFPCAFAYRTTALIASNTTITVAQFTTGFGGAELYDNAGVHSLSTNTSRMTVPTGAAGLWSFGYQLGFASNASGQREAWMEKNSNGAAGGTRYAWWKLPANGADIHVMTGSIDVTMADGDYMELFAYQSSGGSLNFMNQNGDCFWASYRGPIS